jgi:lipoprotein-releasing system ATP-binding protein
VVGKSGSGKSTLLYILSTMDTDYEGELILDGESMKNKSNEELAKVRNEKIGFVFQFHYLWNEFDVLTNIMLPGMKLAKVSEDKVRENAICLLEKLGMKKLAYRNANQLSGGEKQRVAIARALINEPLIIMCDEPTGNLDKKNSEIVLNIFRDIAREKKQSILVVTHDPDFAEGTDRIIQMEDGRIV